MSCCGQKRAALASTFAQVRSQRSPSPAPESGDRLMRYLGKPTLTLTGPKSGRVYFFAESGSTAVIDEKDIEALLRTRLFVRDTGSPIPA